MASILRVNTLTDASSNNSTAMSTINQGTAKAWVNFNGTGTIAERDSFNVSSLDDESTGKYGVNFSSAMSNVNYAITGLSGGTDNDQNISLEATSNHTPTTSLYRIVNRQCSNNTIEDSSFVLSSVLGDFA
jgi:RecA/RadA recombinase